MAAVVLMFRAVSGPAPYEATWAEVVVVPVGEELLFRGVVLGLVLAVLGGQGMRYARGAAVVVSAVAFGLGHLGDLGYVPVDFLAVQVVAATLFGLLAGWVRVRTDSMAGQMALHMVMNGFAVL